MLPSQCFSPSYSRKGKIWEKQQNITKHLATLLGSEPGFNHKGSLPRSRRCLQGWLRLDPGRTTNTLGIGCIDSTGYAREQPQRRSHIDVVDAGCISSSGGSIGDTDSRPGKANSQASMLLNQSSPIRPTRKLKSRNGRRNYHVGLQGDSMDGPSASVAGKTESTGLSFHCE